MIKVLVGDLFESQAQTLVNTVNCVGVMGKGIALGFKTRFPDMYEDYAARCKAGVVKLGEPYLYRRLLEPWILNFPTKDHWRSMAKLEDIVRGLRYLKGHHEEWGITSLAVPPLGCGEGQLDWRVVGPTLYRHLRELEVPVALYAPYGTPPDQMDSGFLSQPPELALAWPGQSRVMPGWIALVEILARIESEPYHWPVGRTMFQKITYFATESGIPTGLVFERGSFGPHARDLKSRITQLVNNGLIREHRLGQMFAAKIGPTFEDARKTYWSEINQFEPIVEQVADLFLRMNTKQAEVAATVHYSARSLAQALHDKPTERHVLDDVMQWKQRRKPPIDEGDVARTIRSLAAFGWIRVKPSSDLPLPEEVLADV